MTPRKNNPQSRRMNRLIDEVYREMFLLEAKRPGSEMGLALALLRAWVGADIPAERDRDWIWLKTICPICLRMIEQSLNRGGTACAKPLTTCDPNKVS